MASGGTTWWKCTVSTRRAPMAATTATAPHSATSPVSRRNPMENAWIAQPPANSHSATCSGANTHATFRLRAMYCRVNTGIRYRHVWTTRFRQNSSNAPAHQK